MAKNRRWVLLMFLAAVASILSIYLVRCATEGGEMQSCQGGAQNMQSAAKVELSLGANEEAIRSFLNSHQFTFTYDRFASRYQGIIRSIENPPGVDCAIVAYIYVDKDGKFLKSEFVASYTGV